MDLRTVRVSTDQGASCASPVGGRSSTQEERTDSKRFAMQLDSGRKAKKDSEQWLTEGFERFDRPLPALPQWTKPTKNESPLPPLPQSLPLIVPHQTGHRYSSGENHSQTSQASCRSRSSSTEIRPASNNQSSWDRNTWLRSQSLQLQRGAPGWSSGSLVSGNSEELPEMMEQVHALCDRVRASGDVRAQVALCKWLMEAAALRLGIEPSPDGAPNIIKTTWRGKKYTLTEMMILEARRVLKRLATTGHTIGQSGDSEAQFLLAECHGMGALGMRIDHERAFRWYIQASKQNHAEATYRAAVCHELGVGTGVDGNRAVVFYRKGAHLSHVASMYKLGMILLRGYCQQAPMRREAVSWLQRAAAATTVAAKSETEMMHHQGVPHALHTLAMIQLTDELASGSSSLIADPAYALELLHEAAQLGYRPSQLKLGALYEHGKLVEIDEARSIYWYTLACLPRQKSANPPTSSSQSLECSSVEAALALSAWYLTGSKGILIQSDREAYLWARKAASLAKKSAYAAKLGIFDEEDDDECDKMLTAKAYYVVGVYMEHGVGLAEPNLQESEKWFQAAAALGHQDAVRRLEQRATSIPIPSEGENEDKPDETPARVGGRLCIIM